MKKVTYIFTLHIIQGICEEKKRLNIKKVLSCKNFVGYGGHLGRGVPLHFYEKLL